VPLLFGVVERRSHDYVRHGTTTPFAEPELAAGQVVDQLHRRHRATEFLKFQHTSSTMRYPTWQSIWSWSTTIPTKPRRLVPGEAGQRQG
jgi:hypothetical protein